MNPLLEQFLLEARDFLQGIGEKLIALETQPDDSALMNELFRLVHTLKGNSGLFDFPEMTRLLHASEDVMDAVREGRIAYSQQLADRLLDAMDRVGAMLDEIEQTGALSAAMSEPVTAQVTALRALLPTLPTDDTPTAPNAEPSAPHSARPETPPLAELPERARLLAFQAASPEVPLLRVRYYPDAECFFKGEDPFYQARNVPGVVWGTAYHTDTHWPPLLELDCYRCVVMFDLLVRAPREVVVEYFRYVPQEVDITTEPLLALVVPCGHPNGGPVYGDFVAEALSLLDANDFEGLRASVEVMLELAAPELWLASALRWVRALLDTTPTQTRALRRLIEALNTLTPPEWCDADWQDDTALTAPVPTPSPAPLPAPAPDVPAVPTPPLAEEDRSLIDQILTVQAEILALPDDVAWFAGRLHACAATLRAISTLCGVASQELDRALQRALAEKTARPLADWLAAFRERLTLADAPSSSIAPPATATTPLAIQVPANQRALLAAILSAQSDILGLPDGVDWLPGRLKACAATLRSLLATLGEATAELDAALDAALAATSAKPLQAWLAAFRARLEAVITPASAAADTPTAPPAPTPSPTASSTPVATPPSGVAAAPAVIPAPHPAPSPPAETSEAEVKFGRRAEDAQLGKVLKVDQIKIDRLMNLIGEMVVAKNSLPYLARRAEDDYGVRDLAREIKAQYAVINRIAEEMQDAIMQVRMMPVSFIFQRFPRLVRDLSRKLGKEVELLLEGEDTEADKNIIEALADPLIHIVRNSLDHGIELPEARRAAGKPAAGTLRIRASQESDHVIIEISDDGKGIDPAVVKRKAYEKGLIDETQLERLSDAEAQNLIFAAGFSTAEQISDLSGRGVGMDVVRSALDKVGGSVHLTSTVGKGTTLRLALPLSMAVTNVMIIEAHQQIFGVPMAQVVETVRLPACAVSLIKHQKTAVLRGRIVPLVSLNELLAIPSEPQRNADDEYAVLVVRVGSEPIGLLVDDFNEVVDVILKPLPGELAKLSCYAGSALLGDGSVLMVLNPKELF